MDFIGTPHAVIWNKGEALECHASFVACMTGTGPAVELWDTRCLFGNGCTMYVAAHIAPRLSL